MKLFSILKKYSHRPVLLITILFGALAGGMSTALLFLVNEALFGEGVWNNPKAIVAFIALLPLSAVIRFLASYTLMKLGAEAACRLQVELSRRILAAPLSRLEALGQHRLLVALTEDIGSVIDALQAVPVFFINIAVVLACLGYLGWMSWQLLLLTLVFMVIGAVSYQIPILAGIRRQEYAREIEDDLFGHFRGATEGVKELKMNRRRREGFLGDLEGSATALKDFRLSAMKIFIAAASWGNLLFFILLGILAFWIPGKLPELSADTFGRVGMVLLYILSPLQAVLNGFPTLTQADVAVRKVERLGLSLAKDPEELSTDPKNDPSESWQSLVLEGVTHRYEVENEPHAFTLGPVDLSFRPGELVFLTGGNGSGKTTLAKVLLGLYPPDDGRILLDGKEVDGHTRDAYRQLFSVVFSDFFLFEKLLGLDAPDLDGRSQEYLELLRLKHKVRVEQGRLSTLDLSQGQRKRLALLTSYLEDAPILLFDEWAADQDPEFKEVFYHHLLPALKAQGKLVLVISHDDRYYGVADRVVKFDYGQIVAAPSPEPVPAARG
ncbi:MAG: cyclic peptide export ABC transporter [Acidobacteria bacterium]|nr:cyclic peptide export ABC transporter [Acidobacteriota bacterium]